MALQGTIVRATPAVSSGADIGAKPYIARRANGDFIDSFASVREAQIPIELSSGGYPLVWTREDRNGIEAYRGEDSVP